MPSVAETTWGVWGEPEQLKAWEPGAPKLYGETGGKVKPEFASTLSWFYKKAQNPEDREHCLRLLSQIELKKEDYKEEVQLKPSDSLNNTLWRNLTYAKRPVSAKAVENQVRRGSLQRPKSAHVSITVKSDKQAHNYENSTEKQLTSYQKQQYSVSRLSRPKTAKPATTIIRTKISRPKSAMASVERKTSDDPYLTTHEREFPGYPAAHNMTPIRPSSSKGFTAPYTLSDPVGGTTGQNEFYWKESTKNKPIRSGSSSGNRRNNPHPHESFMVWKLPNKFAANTMLTATAPHLGYRELTNEVLDQILRDQLKTTYQNDYIGIPQGYQVKTAIDAPADWKTKVRRPLDTTLRYAFVRPQQHSELIGNTTRFGCNKKKGIAAIGAVPTVTSNHVKNQEVIKRTTTYNTEFRNRYGQPDLEQLLDNQTNKNLMDRFLRYSRVDIPKDKTSKVERPDSKSSQKGPKWVTKWEGPHHHEHQ